MGLVRLEPFGLQSPWPHTAIFFFKKKQKGPPRLPSGEWVDLRLEPQWLHLHDPPRVLFLLLKKTLNKKHFLKLFF